jgi:hypothetical protein
MKINVRLGAAALALCGPVIMFTACSGSQTPFNPPAAMTRQSAARMGVADNTGSSTVPAPNTTLVYVASSTGCAFIEGSICHALVSIYSYPNGEYQGKWVDQTSAPIGTSTGGECADQLGHVFVTYSGTSGEILEFAHGGTHPMATLNDPKGSPIACAVDPMTGNLAVINSGSAANLLIYRGTSKIPAAYTSDRLAFSSVGYDDKGNAFLDGTTGLFELPRGGTSFENITLDRKVESFGSVQWDGQHLTVADFGANVIYRFTINGTRGTEVGATPLANGGGTWRFTQTWIEPNSVFAAMLGPGVCLTTCPGSVDVWNYPHGGLPLKNIGGLGDFANPNGVTVSRLVDPPR